MSASKDRTVVSSTLDEGQDLLGSIFDKKEPNKDEIYLGLSDVRFETEFFDFGKGILLRSTYAHIFAPYLAAFIRPVSPGQAHPAPWKTVSGGQAKNVQYELYVPLDFELDAWFDRLNTAWWILALLRLKGSSYITAPVASNFSFSVIGEMDIDANFTTIEFNYSKLPISDDHGKPITLADLEWVRDNWHEGGRLFRENIGFAEAFVAADTALHERSSSVALVIVWGALEKLFANYKQELTYRVSLNIATYLEPQGNERSALFKKVKKLYGARSQAAHGDGSDNYQEFKESYLLLKHALIKMIEIRHVPSADDIERMILCGTE